ncbi:MAG: alpha-1,2-fucosyltransferase [Rhodocyclaceae bacterium]
MSKIVVALKGGLGNQLFGYAAGLALSQRLDAVLDLDIAAYEDPRERHYALAPFLLPEKIVRADTTIFARGSLQDRIWRRVKQRLGMKQAGLPVFRERGFKFDPDFKGLSAPVFLDGYFQSPRYFESCAPLMRTRLLAARDEVLSEASRAMLRQIQSCDAICVHVRRGDYVTNPVSSRMHGLCGMSYYAEGLEAASEGLAAPHCFIFSDDPAWVRDNMRLQYPWTVVDVNAEDAAHEDLWLMSACRSFVIANSSLSWWGAWLGQHQAKRVVAPLQWFRSQDKDTSDLIPADWIRI